MEKVVAAVVALLTALTDKLLAFVAGAKTQQAKDLQGELEGLNRADQAVRGLDGMSGDERLHELKRRGLLRVSGSQAKRD